MFSCNPFCSLLKERSASVLYWVTATSLQVKLSWRIETDLIPGTDFNGRLSVLTYLLATVYTNPRLSLPRNRAVLFWRGVTQRSPYDCCVTSLVTTAEETKWSWLTVTFEVGSCTNVQHVHLWISLDHDRAEHFNFSFDIELTVCLISNPVKRLKAFGFNPKNWKSKIPNAVVWLSL